MKWITRERPKIDRIACPWLVARFIDPQADFLYVPGADVMRVAQETGACYGGVLYVDSLTDEDGPAPTYLKLLEFNAATIVKGFQTQP